MERVDVVYALILDDTEKSVLMVKNKGGGWSLPGGAVEKGETLEQAVIRECKEETNLTIEVEGIVAVNEAFFENRGHHSLFMTYKAKVVEGVIQILYKTEIEEVKWIDIENANQLMPYHTDGVESLLECSVPYSFQG